MIIIFTDTDNNTNYMRPEQILAVQIPPEFNFELKRDAPPRGPIVCCHPIGIFAVTRAEANRILNQLGWPEEELSGVPKQKEKVSH